MKLNKNSNFRDQSQTKAKIENEVAAQCSKDAGILAVIPIKKNHITEVDADAVELHLLPGSILQEGLEQRSKVDGNR